jgi:tripartite-type tricarboxylate transporter receptor subunit TctC
MAGEIDGFFATVALAQSARDNAKVRMLGVTAERGASPFLPGVPSFADQGVKDMSFRVLFLLMARAGTPPDVRARLERLLRGVAESDEMRQARASLSVEPFPGTVDDAKAEMARIVESLRRAESAAR